MPDASPFEDETSHGIQATRVVASKVSAMARSLIPRVLLIQSQTLGVGSMPSVIIGNERCHESMVMFDNERRSTGEKRT